MEITVLCTFFDQHTAGIIQETCDATAIQWCHRLRCALVAHSAQPTTNNSALSVVEEVLAYLWETIHSVAFKYVHPGYRDAYGWASLVQCTLCKEISSTEEHNKCIDLGILLGSDHYREALINLLIHKKERKRCRYMDNESFNTKKNRPTYTFLESHSSEQKHQPIQRLVTPDLRTFYEQHLLPQVPVVLVNCIDEWPAMKKWNHLDYLSQGDYQYVITQSSYMTYSTHFCIMTNE